VVAVPFEAWREDERLRQADSMLDSLSDFTAELLDRLDAAQG
jgi:hypothetical protein